MNEHYRIATHNLPEIADIGLSWSLETDRPELKKFGEPYWEIEVGHDGAVSVFACRPTEDEMEDGDMLGRFGSKMELERADRGTIRRALRLARILCNANPGVGVPVFRHDLEGVKEVTTPIPVYVVDKVNVNEADIEDGVAVKEGER